MVERSPAAAMADSPAARAATYARMTGAGCATLTYTRCETPTARAAATIARIDARSTRSNSDAFPGPGWGDPTRWITVSPARSADCTLAESSASPTNVAAPGGTRWADSGRGRTRTRGPRARG